MTLKHAWAKIVKAVDYDGHMADVGQAQANAEIVRDMITRLALPRGSKILFAGAGTGQMFDYVSGAFLSDFDLTFTDINEGFLETLRLRVTRASLTNFRTMIDDVEETALTHPVDLTVLVLVLEHVDWQRALQSLAALPSKRFFIILQKNPSEMTTNVSPHRELRGSLAEASKGEQAHLIDEKSLDEFLTDLHYRQIDKDERVVPDDKRMCGLIFEAGPN